jgi:hypothetical protein
MPNVITAGNSSNGGTAITTDTSGTLNIVTGSGSGANAITIDASQNVTFANAISVAGNATITGTLTATGGVSGGIRSGTAVASTSGTSIDFTSIPSGVKRITVMFNGVSTSGSSTPQIQIGDSGGIETTGYLSTAVTIGTSTASSGVSSTTGFSLSGSTAAFLVFSGSVVLCLQTGTTWVASGNLNRDDTTGFVNVMAGKKALSDTLDRVRITTVNGTDTFDAGSINILFE